MSTSVTKKKTALHILFCKFILALICFLNQSVDLCNVCFLLFVYLDIRSVWSNNKMISFNYAGHGKTKKTNRLYCEIK